MERVLLVQMPNVDPGLVLLRRDQVLVVICDHHAIAIRDAAILMRGQYGAGLKIERGQRVRLIL